MGLISPFFWKSLNQSSVEGAVKCLQKEGMSEQMTAERSIFDFALEFIIFFFGLGVFFVPSSIPFNWWIIVSVSLLLFIFEYRKATRKKLRVALLMGVFLMVFDFAFENVGTLVFGYWGTNGSSLFVLAVPIEVMLTCLFGGTAWALYVLSAHALFVARYQSHSNTPLRYSLILLDLFFFGVGGAAAEWCLIQKGAMYYAAGWTTPHAFVAYFATWTLLHTLLNKLTPPMTEHTDEAGASTYLG